MLLCMLFKIPFIDGEITAQLLYPLTPINSDLMISEMVSIHIKANNSTFLNFSFYVLTRLSCFIFSVYVSL